MENPSGNITDSELREVLQQMRRHYLLLAKQWFGVDYGH